MSSTDGTGCKKARAGAGQGNIEFLNALNDSLVAKAMHRHLGDDHQGDEGEADVACNSKLEKQKFHWRNHDDFDASRQSPLVNQPSNEFTGEWEGGDEAKEKEGNVILQRTLQSFSDGGENLTTGGLSESLDRRLEGFTFHALTPLRLMWTMRPTHKRV